MRYLICFLVATAFLLSPLRCQAQSSDAPKHEAQQKSTRAEKTSLKRVTVILTSGQKFDGEMLGWINNRFLIRQKGAVQSFAYSEITDIKVKHSFFGKVRRTVKFGLEVAGSIVLIPAIIVALPFAPFICRNGC